MHKKQLRTVTEDEDTYSANEVFHEHQESQTQPYAQCHFLSKSGSKFQSSSIPITHIYYLPQVYHIPMVTQTEGNFILPCISRTDFKRLV